MDRFQQDVDHEVKEMVEQAVRLTCREIAEAVDRSVVQDGPGWLARLGTMRLDDATYEAAISTPEDAAIVTAEMVRDRRLKPQDLLCWAAIATAGRPDPSRREIEQATGLTATTVWEAVGRLRQAGWLGWSSVKRNGSPEGRAIYWTRNQAAGCPVVVVPLGTQVARLPRMPDAAALDQRLSARDFRVLAVLRDRPAATCQDLVDLLGHAPVSVAASLARLGRLGYLEEMA